MGPAFSMGGARLHIGAISNHYAPMSCALGHSRARMGGNVCLPALQIQCHGLVTLLG